MTQTATTLKLLTRDGAIVVTFVPELHDDHYKPLREVAVSDVTPQSLRELLEETARQWNRSIVIESV